MIVTIGDGGGKYSLEETAIGTWIDGRTIYRKVVISDEGVTLGYSNPFIYTHGLDILTPISAIIMPVHIDDDDVVTDTQTMQGNNTHHMAFTQTQVIAYKWLPANFNDWRYIVIMEYTKPD